MLRPGCQAGHPCRDFPAGHFAPDMDRNSVVSRGGSSITDPLGQVLAGPVYHSEELLVADLDMADIVRAKYDFDMVGHSARPDLFQLVVNETAARPVRAMDETPSTFINQPTSSTVNRPPS